MYSYQQRLIGIFSLYIIAWNTLVLGPLRALCPSGKVSDCTLSLKLDQQVHQSVAITPPNGGAADGLCSIYKAFDPFSLVLPNTPILY